METKRDNRPARRTAGLEEVAALAGVAVATVDRVLNERGGVRPDTAGRVLAAARQLRLKRVLPSSHHRGLRIEVLLNRPDLPMIQRMNEAFVRLAGTLDRSVILQRSMLADDKPGHLAERLRATRCNAVIVYGAENEAVIKAIDALGKAGVAVVTLTTDLPSSSRLYYAGIDHHAAGQTAGFFMGRRATRPGPVIVLCHQLHAHSERIRGFRQALATHNSHLVVSDILDGGDESPRSERLLCEALRRRPDAAGIYNVGGANDAVRAALQRAPPAHPPIFIGHELDSCTRGMLQDGSMTVTIDQNPERQASHAIDFVLAHFGYAVAGSNGLDSGGTVPFTVHGPYNLGP